MFRSWKFWVVLGAIGAIVGLFTFGFTTNPKEVKSPLVGKPAPEFTVQRLGGGETLSLADLRGTPVILNFWASWCVACRDEAAVLEAAHQRLWVEQEAVRVIGIAVQDTPEKAKAFAERFGKNYFLALDDPEGTIGLNYGLYGVPETFFIDGQGIIRGKRIGALTPASLRKEVAQLLNPEQVAGS